MQLVFASNNPNKIQEIQLLLPTNIKILSLHDIGCFEEIAETANTIAGNAILKANYVTQKYGLNCFADDSGLEVDYLNGKPGVHSARYAGNQRNDNDNVNKLLLALNNQQNRKANFKTIICLNLNGIQTLFTGLINGTITTQKEGNQGFGYDPIFTPEGYQITFAEMNKLQKTQISHRGIATKQLINFLESV
ncbi:MAG: non-canonical purine NTP diphosphatase [Flavobacterium sp.]|nr:non-canonical purine NTP diphosphatase [Flavobacterium sp.]